MEKRSQSFDVCIVCALYEEAEAVLSEFSTRCKVSFDKKFSDTDLYEYRYTTIQNNRGEPLIVLVTWLADNGPVRTGLHLKPFLQEFHPRFAAMTGICAGYKEKDVWLGDLIVAEYAYHYEMGKDTLGKDGQKQHEIQTTTYGVTPQVLQYVRGFQDWRDPVARLKRPKKQQEKINGSESLKARPPRCYIAPMASGMVVKEDEPFPWLREHINRKTLALEMEAAAFYLTLQEVSPLGIHSLVVKGVSDYADGSKNDTYHAYAARASAIYLLYFIREYVTSTTMPRRGVPSSIHDGLSGIWNVPYRRNPFFTGREDLLKRLRDILTRVNVTAPQAIAISGLGGIGKTQIALEYAYLYREAYRFVFWVRAKSRETLVPDFAGIADLLLLPEKNEQDQNQVVSTVKQWFTEHDQWLLILDNADDVAMVSDFIPLDSKGHVLLTSRAQAMGTLAQPIDVEKMGMVEGTLFLLHRAKILAEDAPLEQASSKHLDEAEAITIEMDFLPLALDQAGAYIDEIGCSLSAYLDSYRKHRKKLLKRRSELPTDHPESVATTWSLSFEKVKEANPAAADLLRFCAFLEPDAIPESLMSEGSAHLSPVLQRVAADTSRLDEAIKELRKFSLVSRNPDTEMLSLHRLVQSVLKDTMKKDIQQRWVERTIKAVNTVFPEDPHDIITWPRCSRYLSQAQICSTLIEQYVISFAEAADLLNRTSLYLYEHALYSQAEPLLLRALAIREQQLGAMHPDTATSLSSLANLYERQGKYVKAEPLLVRALAIREQQLGTSHPDTADSLNNLANLYESQGRYAEAEPLYQRALAIREQQLGTSHPNTADSLNNLANLYESQGRYAEAEPLYQRALAITEEQLGTLHPNTAACMNNLAYLYRRQGKHVEAEPLYQRALVITEEQLGTSHPDTAISLNNLASLYQKQGKYIEAESLYQRALTIKEQQLGTLHPYLANSLAGLASLYESQEKYSEAELFYTRAVVIREKQFGASHLNTATSLNNLANLYNRQGKYSEAEPFYVRVLAIREEQSGASHLNTATSLNNLATVYQKQGKYGEAEPLYVRALAIREEQLGTSHLDTATSLNNLANLYLDQGKYGEAEPLYVQALAISEKILGSEHSNTKLIQNNYVTLLEAMKQNKQREL